MALTVESCKDSDTGVFSGGSSEQLSRPMVRKDDNTGKGSTDPYNCVITDYNTANLFWYTMQLPTKLFGPLPSPSLPTVRLVGLRV